MLASAALDTLFSDTTAPTLRPLTPVRVLPTDVDVTLLTSDVRLASDFAVTLTWPAASTVLSTMRAFTSERVLVPNALAIAGSPISASTVLNSTFCACHPIVLNASVTPMALPPDSTALSTLAPMLAVFCASTSTFPSAPEVETALLEIVALAALTTTLVAIRPLAASELPVPPKRLVDALDFASLRSSAVSEADSIAATRTLPVVAATVARSMVAVAPPRTSLSATAPDTPIASPFRNGFGLAAAEAAASTILLSIEESSVARTVTPAPPVMVRAPVYPEVKPMLAVDALLTLLSETIPPDAEPLAPVSTPAPAKVSALLTAEDRVAAFSALTVIAPPADTTLSSM